MPAPLVRLVRFSPDHFWQCPIPFVLEYPNQTDHFSLYFRLNRTTPNLVALALLIRNQRTRLPYIVVESMSQRLFWNFNIRTFVHFIFIHVNNNEFTYDKLKAVKFRLVKRSNIVRSGESVQKMDSAPRYNFQVYARILPILIVSMRWLTIGIMVLKILAIHIALLISMESQSYDFSTLIIINIQENNRYTYVH